MTLTEKLLAMDGSEILGIDGWLEPHRQTIIDRWSHFKGKLWRIEHEFGGVMSFSDRSNYGIFVEYEGKNYSLSQFDQFPRNKAQPTLVYREWVGNAKTVSLCGEFNDWNTTMYRSTHQEYGVHTIRIPFVMENGEYACPIKDGQRYKVFIETHQGATLWRQPLYCNRLEYSEQANGLEPVFETSARYEFQHGQPDVGAVLRIYECHVGMAGEEERVHSYAEFTENVLPRVREKGYNCIQLMAVAEHAYYASFGYQVTSFFAPSSRYGRAVDLKRLVDRAHELGLLVLLDLVHGHASRNEADGLSRYDGSDFFFLAGGHPLWDARVFDYEHVEAVRYLLQNVRYWLDEFGVDGFRFDGCTSMLYWHRSAGVGYTGNYEEYFGANSRVDVGALSYLRLAHVVAAAAAGARGRRAVTVAEDVSGYPGLAAPLAAGGVGFGYRFQMAAPDLWVQMMRRGYDEGLDEAAAVDTGEILHALTNRRHQERHIIYAECHDQALVGDKTLLMWLLNEKIYTDMSCLRPQEPRTKRGIALHKVIRMVTTTLGGEGYLAFMGNEFGHPEWIDFPRRENGWSYKHCRRQWSLEDQDHTRYHQLGRFDRDLMRLSGRYQWNVAREYCTMHDQGRKLMCYDRGDVFVVVSFYHSSLYDVVLPVRCAGQYKLLLNTEEEYYGGFQDVTQLDERYRCVRSVHYSQMGEHEQRQLNGFQHAIILDTVLCRTGMLFEIVRDQEK